MCNCCDRCRMKFKRGDKVETNGLTGYISLIWGPNEDDLRAELIIPIINGTLLKTFNTKDLKLLEKVQDGST